MWIKCNREVHHGNHIKIPEIAEPVEFSENGKANVTAQVADMLVSEVDHIEKVEQENDEKDNDSKINEDSDE